jgi:transaldolase
MNPIMQLHELGQSIWYDNIQRNLLENGALAAMIQNGDIRGVTSNPTIFQNAIAKTNDYDAALKPLARSGMQPEPIFFSLAVEDIRNATDLFRGLYDKTSGGDGYVSLEVSPYLANDTQATIEQALALWKQVDRPNLMIKIPATLAGLPAIRKAIASGLNINVTLIFSLERYAAVMEAYISGLEDRLAAGHSVQSIASVASFFVSRVDTKVDAKLEEIIKQGGPNASKAASLVGKIAIANSRLAYNLYEQIFGAARFEKLAKAGARRQRPLWASTSTKNPAYRDVIYIEELIAPNTVNTVPPSALENFRDHGVAELRLEGKVAESSQVITDLESLGISMAQVTLELENEGVKSFENSYTSLLKTIDERRVAFITEPA